MDSVKVEIKIGERVSRVEVIVRLILGIVYAIIAGIVGIVVSILIFLNFFTCLLLARRIAADFIAKYITWILQINAYLCYVTDERPPFML